MTKEELEFVVAMAEQYSRTDEAVRQNSRNVATVAAEMRTRTDAEVATLKAEIATLTAEYEAMGEVLGNANSIIAARMTALDRLTNELAKEKARPVGLVWHRAKNADGSPNLPGADAWTIVTTSGTMVGVAVWGRFDNGDPAWVDEKGKFYSGIDWWAAVHKPSETDDGGAA